MFYSYEQYGYYADSYLSYIVLKLIVYKTRHSLILCSFKEEIVRPCPSYKYASAVYCI